jgi:hypothetical protein
MQKEILGAESSPDADEHPGWLDLDALARVALTSEDARHPIEAALGSAPSHGWRAAQPGEQTIWISFHVPQRIRQVSLGFTTSEPRTHEFVLSWSGDGGVSYREVVRQQFNFSAATSHEDEDYFPDLPAVTDLKLTIRPDLADAGVHATLRHLRLR